MFKIKFVPYVYIVDDDKICSFRYENYVDTDLLTVKYY
jgi:hypothetical protein